MPAPHRPVIRAVSSSRRPRVALCPILPMFPEPMFGECAAPAFPLLRVVFTCSAASASVFVQLWQRLVTFTYHRSADPLTRPAIVKAHIWESRPVPIGATLITCGRCTPSPVGQRLQPSPLHPRPSHPHLRPRRHRRCDPGPRVLNLAKTGRDSAETSGAAWTYKHTRGGSGIDERVLRGLPECC